MDLLQRAPLFAGPGFLALPLGADDAPALKRFLDANPLYSELVNGRPWEPGDALNEITERPPLPHGAAHALALLEPGSGRWLGFVSLLEDLVSPGVTHTGLFLIATAAHGSGLAARVHQAMEAWARGRGARWLRLGVVVGNARAEAFWSRLGYVELRLRRFDYPRGPTDVSVRVKSLAGGLDEYLQRVERDRPGSP